MNKREALETTKELWTWLAENPESAKWAWPKFKTSNLGGFLDCPLCVYSASLLGKEGRDFGFCSPHCPLYYKWIPRKTKVTCPCESKGSPYLAWFHATQPAARRRNALKIVELCKEELNKLEEVKNEQD